MVGCPVPLVWLLVRSFQSEHAQTLQMIASGGDHRSARAMAEELLPSRNGKVDVQEIEKEDIWSC